MADSHWGPVDWRPQGTDARQKTTKSGRRWARGILLTIGGLTILGMISAMAVVVYGYSTTKLPAANAEFNTATTFVYYNDGKSELGNFAIQNRTPLSFAKMPETIKQASVAAENRTFWTDKGIDPKGILRAAFSNARGNSTQGAAHAAPF